MATKAIPLETASPPQQTTRWGSLFTQENFVTSLAAVFVAAAVFLPLIALIVSSFQVQDELGFSATWGLGNYKLMVEHAPLREAFFNTIAIATGATVLSTIVGVSLAWLNARTNCP